MIGNGSSSSTRRTPIHILDNDCLLNIFQFYRPAPIFSSKDEEDAIKILGGGNWNHERWWYSLAQVCRRWWYLMFESASLFGLSLICTYGTQVAEMLAFFPPLPLIVDYLDLHDDLTADDELGIILALWHCDRVRCIRLMQPISVLQRLFVILEGEYPNLEYLIIERHPSEHRSIVHIPKTFRAPRLRYFVVMGLPIPIESLSFTTIGNLASLSFKVRSCAYFHPNILLQQLSLVPQRESTGNINTFYSCLPSDDINRQSLQRAITRRVTPYLRHFGIQGANADLETLLTNHFFERRHLYFFDQLTHLILRYRQFMSTVEMPRLKIVTLTFLKDHSRVNASSFPYWPMGYTLSMDFGNRHLDLQVARTAQVFHMLRTLFSVVENLALNYDRHSISSEWNNEADRTQWRKLFRTFGNVKTLSIGYGLTGQISRSLQPDEGESPIALLPELVEVIYSNLEPRYDAFSSFLEGRKNAGRLVTVIRR